MIVHDYESTKLHVIIENETKNLFHMYSDIINSINLSL